MRRGRGNEDDPLGTLDSCLELLYEAGREAEGAQGILSLCREALNLEALIQNHTVMGALTRVLQEEYKKSVEITFHILRL